MTYTVKNLRDVDDVAPQAGVGEVQELRFSRGALHAERTGLSLMGVKPGRRQAVAHRHDEAEEVYVVLSGSGRIKLGDDIVDVQPLDAVRIGPAVWRAIEAGPEGIEYLAFGARHDGDGATMPVEEFWP